MLNTAVIPKMILLAEVDSTNNYTAKLLSEQKLTHGTVILAEKQTAGRGQRGNTWTSRKNQFTGSFFTETAFLSATRLPYLNFAVALAVRSAVSELSGEKAAIKWPNDILVNDRKIAGILIEAQWLGAEMKGAIVGIGLNLLKEEGMEKAAFMEDFRETPVSAPETALVIWKYLSENIELLRMGSFKAISEKYHSFLWRINVDQAAVLADETEITGRIKGVNDEGNLLFESGEKELSFGIQEIRFFY